MKGSVFCENSTGNHRNIKRDGVRDYPGKIVFGYHLESLAGGCVSRFTASLMESGHLWSNPTLAGDQLFETTGLRSQEMRQNPDDYQNCRKTEMPTAKKIAFFMITTKKRLVVAKRHFMFKTFSAFSRHHQILEKQIQESKYDGLIYTHSQSYLDPVMRWKPQKTVDLLYQEKALMAYNKKENVDSGLKISQNSTEPKENAISEFIINPNRTVTLLREREDKVYPNRVAVVEKIKKIAREEKNMFNVLKGLTVSMMRSYHNEVKRDLLKKGAGHLLDVGSGFGGDITKWDHYKSVTCVDPSYSNIKELKKRLGTNKKVRVIQTRIEHLRGFEKSITTLSCFFCITLIDIDKLIRIAQRTFSDKHKCAFLCIVMSKKYIIEFFEARKVKEHICEAYSIRLESKNKIYIHIPNTIVTNQTEDLVDVDKLIEQFTSIGFKLETRNRLNRNKFMSSNEYLLSCMYESLVMTRTK
uniref:Methyltransferase type 11 domain-containing protein n=2 Tax=Physcomitrium patens TaxID=3218 RepID=A0A7I4EH68_PHYPA